MRDMKLRDMKMRHHVAGVENARHENARNAIVWNTACSICLSIAEQECMKPISRYLKKTKPTPTSVLKKTEKNRKPTKKYRKKNENSVFADDDLLI